METAVSEGHTVVGRSSHPRSNFAGASETQTSMWWSKQCAPSLPSCFPRKQADYYIGVPKVYNDQIFMCDHLVKTTPSCRWNNSKKTTTIYLCLNLFRFLFVRLFPLSRFIDGIWLIGFFSSFFFFPVVFVSVKSGEIYGQVRNVIFAGVYCSITHPSINKQQGYVYLFWRQHCYIHYFFSSLGYDQVHIFLSKALEFTDRSGLNVTGNVNTGNVTAFEVRFTHLARMDAIRSGPLLIRSGPVPFPLGQFALRLICRENGCRRPFLSPSFLLCQGLK